MRHPMARSGCLAFLLVWVLMGGCGPGLEREFPPTCTDAVRNNTETDVDCGGGACPACTKGQRCASSTDCVSALCMESVCQEPACDNTVKDGAETDVDCGGGTCPACTKGQRCASSTDCASALCMGSVCQELTCGNTVKDGTETDVDCGGLCPVCGVGLGCAKNSDCARGFCLDQHCFLPDPATIAPPLNSRLPTSFADSVAFLFTGPNALQQSVAPGTLDMSRLSVLRGRVLDRNAMPLANVTLTVLGHPEYGNTLTRTDGMFDLAVNGGQPFTLVYTREGLLPVQRQVNAPWKEFVWAPDVLMIALDSRVTSIDLATATTLQIAQGSPVTDADGTRQATLQFSPGTTAVMEVGESTQPLTTLHVRATEYTVGVHGPQMMPATLPPSSGYTYAVELSIDEALAAGAMQVRFNQPVYLYVDNFTGFPVGGLVPTGYYDRQQAQWVPSTDGRVIKVLGVTDGLADLDVTGSGLPASPAELAVLDISDAERRRLASTALGTSLWRVPVRHFSSWDCNWPFGPPSDAQPPPAPTMKQSQTPPDDPCQKAGSIIGCEDQSLAESLPIPGVPYSLRYHSGHSGALTAMKHFTTPISGPTVPSSLKRIEVEFSGMGRQSLTTFPPTPNQSFTLYYDGKDVYGRALVGPQPIQVKVNYVY